MGCREKPLDWDKVDKLLIAGCLGTEIAAHFDMHPQTFYTKVEQKYNTSFTQYSAQKKEQGHSILRYKQFEKAAKGDNTMLLWLGKNKLNQRDKPKEDSIEEDAIRKLISFLSDKVSKPEVSSGPTLETEQSLLHQGSSGEQDPISP